MAGQIGDLVISLGLDMAQMRGDVGKASAQMDSFFTKVDSRAAKMQKTLAGAATAMKAFFGAAIVQQAIQGVDALVDSIAQVGDQAEALGVSAQSMQAFTYAAKLSGASQEDLAKQLRGVGESFVDAANGGKAASVAYKALGIDVEKLNKEGVTTEGIFRTVLDKLAQMPPGIERTSTATAIFGKQGQQVLEQLGDGFLEAAEGFKRSGKGFSDTVITLADEAKKSFVELGASIEGGANAPLQILLPNIIALNRTFADFFSTISDDSPQIAAYFKYLGESVDAMAEGFVLGFGATLDVLEATIALVKGVWEYTKLAGEASVAMGVAMERVASLDWSGAKAALQTFGDDAVATVQRVSKEIDEGFSLDKIESLPAKFRLARLEAQNLAAAPRPDPAKLSVTVDDSDERKKAADKALREQAAAEARLAALKERNEEEGRRMRQSESQKKLDEMLEGYKKEEEEAQKASERLNKIEKEGADAMAKTAAEASQKKLDEMLAGYEKERQAQVAFAQSIQDVFTGGVADALTDVVTGAKDVGDAFTDMAKSISDALVRIAAQKVAEQIFGGVGTQGTEGIGGWIAKLLGGAGGASSASSGGGSSTAGAFASIVAAIFGGARAGGGPIAAGKMYRVGERGPEYIMPSASGMVVPAARAAAAAPRTNNISIAVNIPPSTERRTAVQIASSVGMAVQRAVKRNE